MFLESVTRGDYRFGDTSREYHRKREYVLRYFQRVSLEERICSKVLAMHIHQNAVIPSCKSAAVKNETFILEGTCVIVKGREL